jgi:hypothetical protein
VETLVEQERKFLTFLLGQIYSIHELLAFVPKEGEEFLNFSPRKRASRTRRVRGLTSLKNGKHCWRNKRSTKIHKKLSIDDYEDLINGL